MSNATVVQADIDARPTDQRWASPVTITVDGYEWTQCWDRATYDREIRAARRSAARSHTRCDVRF